MKNRIILMAFSKGKLTRSKVIPLLQDDYEMDKSLQEFLFDIGTELDYVASVPLQDLTKIINPL